MASEAAAVLLDMTGLELHCASQAAMDQFNEGLVAYVSSYGNCLKNFKKALELDGNFALMNCVLGSFWLFGLKQPTDPEVATHLAAVNKLALNSLLPREQFHVDGLRAYATGDLPAACGHWERCAVCYPRDALAIRHAFIGRLMLGQFQEMRDALAGILPYWNKTDSLYPFILSLYSFSLEETCRFAEAESAARQSLALDARSPWATHALGHVIEEDHDVMEGVEFLTSTRSDWTKSGLGNHIAWHLCLYYLDLNDMDALLSEYDGNLVNKVTPDNLFGLLDASSLLWRLECVGVDTGDRWNKVQEAFKPYLDNRANSWYDTHLMMSLSVGGVGSESTARLALADNLVKSLQEYSRSNVSTDCRVADMIGVPTCQALLAFGKQQFKEVVTLLIPLRYDIIRFGGSWAQRQVFSFTLIQAAIKSGQLQLALSLIAQLKAIKPKSQRLPKLYEAVKKMIT